MNSEIFNAKVSIITKSEIRYEGILNQINAQLQNLTLKSVRSFGTEGRRPGNEIPPVSQTFDLIVFRAHEINELKVIQPGEAAINNNDESQQLKNTPAKLSLDTEKPEEQNPQYHSKTPSKTITSRAFDFDEMLEKITDLEKMKNQPQQQNQKYQKSSFFDNLSSTVTEKQLMPRTMTKDDRKNQNDQDTETFGQFYKHNNNNRRGGGNRRTFNCETNDQGYGNRSYNNNNNNNYNSNHNNNHNSYNNTVNNNYNRNNNNYNNNNNNNNNYNNTNNNNNYNNSNRYKNQERVIYVEKKIDKQEGKAQN